jgi:Ca2+/Na+ antiporter
MSSSDDCSMSWLDQQPDACEAIKGGVCSDQVNVVNLFYVYFCMMQGHIYYLIPFGIVFLLFLFDTISSTCENWLATPLTKIGKTLHFSEALSGVTLIALANGSPDVIASFSAAGQASGGTATFLAVGSIFGANLFTTTVVLFRVLTNSENSIKMQYQTILRDLIFFILSTSTIIGFGIYGKITWYMTAGYLSLYVCYCIIVVVQERGLESISSKKEKKEQEEEENPGLQDSLTSGTSPEEQRERVITKKKTIKKTIYEIEKEIMKEVEEKMFVQEYQGVDHMLQIPVKIDEQRPISAISLQPKPDGIPNYLNPASDPNHLEDPAHKVLQSPASETRRTRAPTMIEKVME